MCSGWTPHSWLHWLHHEDLQPDPTGYFRWQKTAGDQSARFQLSIELSAAVLNERIIVCVVGDSLLCYTALVWCEEALGEDHAFSHMGGSEGRRFCTRNGPSRGGASQPKKRPNLGETGEKPHSGTYIFNISKDLTSFCRNVGRV